MGGLEWGVKFAIRGNEVCGKFFLAGFWGGWLERDDGVRVGVVGDFV